MDYRVKNITDTRFNFEGVDIAPRSVSVELNPEVYQRLLALYLGKVLMPVEEPVKAEEPVNTGIPEEEKEGLGIDEEGGEDDSEEEEEEGEEDEKEGGEIEPANNEEPVDAVTPKPKGRPKKKIE